MQRNTIQKDKRAGFDSLLTDQQSLLFKLCDQLLISGFVFEDSTANEIEAGEDVTAVSHDDKTTVFVACSETDYKKIEPIENDEDIFVIKANALCEVENKGKIM